MGEDEKATTVENEVVIPQPSTGAEGDAQNEAADEEEEEAADDSTEDAS